MEKKTDDKKLEGTIEFHHAACGIHIVGLPVEGYAPNNELSKAVSAHMAKQASKEIAAGLAVLKLESADPEGSFPSTGPRFEFQEAQPSDSILEALQRWADLIKEGAPARLEVSDELAELVLKETGKNIHGMYITDWDIGTSVVKDTYTVNVNLSV